MITGCPDRRKARPIGDRSAGLRTQNTGGMGTVSRSGPEAKACTRPVQISATSRRASGPVSTASPGEGPSRHRHRIASAQPGMLQFELALACEQLLFPLQEGWEVVLAEAIPQAVNLAAGLDPLAGRPSRAGPRGCRCKSAAHPSGCGDRARGAFAPSGSGNRSCRRSGIAAPESRRQGFVG
jgi:hypothetical protein